MARYVIAIECDRAETMAIEEDPKTGRVRHAVLLFNGEQRVCEVVMTWPNGVPAAASLHAESPRHAGEKD